MTKMMHTTTLAVGVLDDYDWGISSVSSWELWSLASGFLVFFLLGFSEMAFSIWGLG